MNEVFINYRSDDQPNTATLIARDLARRFGSERVFRASNSIRPSENFAEVLRSGVRNCRVLVAVIGENWLPDVDSPREDWTRWEIQEALRCDKPVVPVLVGRKTERLPRTGMPRWVIQLASLQYVRFDSRNAEADLDRLAAELTELVPELEPAAAQEKTDSPASTANTATDVHGPVFQARDHVQQVGTLVSNPTGPVHTGSGNQYNGTSQA